MTPAVVERIDVEALTVFITVLDLAVAVLGNAPDALDIVLAWIHADFDAFLAGTVTR